MEAISCPPPESSNDSALRNSSNAFERRWAALEMAATRICKRVNITTIIKKEDAASTFSTGSNSGIGVNPYSYADPDVEVVDVGRMSAVANIASSSAANSRLHRSPRVPLKAVITLLGAG